MSKLILLLTLSSIMILITQHPLTLAILLMVNTLITSLITGLLNLNYWYSFMLFMIMIGGMLVLIIYMTTVASNEVMETTIKYIPFVILTGLSMMCLDTTLMNLNINTFETYELNMTNNLSLSKYLSLSHLILIIMVINYLFITLIAIVKITSLKYGSLRQKF